MMTDGYSKVAPLQERGRITTADAKSYRSFDQAPAHTETALQENVFHSMLNLERRRAERSGKPFVLMLLDANLENGPAAGILRQAVDIMIATKRETDLVGWYQRAAILGIIFTE